MMKKVFLILFVGVLGVLVGQRVQGTSATVNDVLLENVEALAEYENSLPTICEVSGNLSCPLNGGGYKYVYQGYSLR